jgi:hypothetical protein
MQNLNHENLSFTVTLAVESKGQKSELSSFEGLKLRQKKCQFQQKSGQAQIYKIREKREIASEFHERRIWPPQKWAWHQSKKRRLEQKSKGLKRHLGQRHSRLSHKGTNKRGSSIKSTRPILGGPWTCTPDYALELTNDS